MRAARALLVAVALAAAQAAVVPEGGPKAREPFGLKEVLDGSFSASGGGATQWITQDDQDFLIYVNSESGDLMQLDLSENLNTTLVKAEVLQQDGHSVSRGSWRFSSDAAYLLWSYQVQAGFRHSTVAKYAVLDVANSTWSDLQDSKLLQHATWAPSGRGLAYVHQNDVYYVPDAGNVTNVTRITTDGEEGVVYNGVPDWAYEEEVLGSGSAMWFSPNGQYLAFAKFNDTEVQIYSYIHYGTSQYTTVEELRYPKPGTENPSVTLHVQDLFNAEAETVTILGPEPESILQNVGWARDILVAVWMNRIQTHSYMHFYEDELGNWIIIHTIEDNEENGWLEVGSLLAPCEAEDEEAATYGVATLLAHDVPWAKASHGRLLQPAVAGPKKTQPLNDTSVATAIYAWNRATGTIYYQAAPADLPSRRHVYAVPTEDFAEPVCLTCEMTQPDGQPCLYASANFSPRTQYAVVTCSGPGPALVVAVKVENDTLGLSSPVLQMQTNAGLRDKLQTRLQPDVLTNITVPLPEDFQAQVRLWLPPDLDENKKYPMIVYVYGGPGSQQVSDAYSVGWGHYLSTSRRIIYAAIDGRGSGQQGNRRLFALYKRLGTVEVEDQISVARVLTERFSFVDAGRVGIWGWSYGGYATAMALARDADDVFACGASVAPVTDWELYDSIYTERYMQTPKDNAVGYQSANVSDRLSNFESHRFLLMHGNADDNVHYQQSMRLVRALELEDILFELESYPDENHGIRSVVQHVYHTMDDFFERCFADIPTNSTTSSTKSPGGGGGGGGDGGASSVLPAPLLLLLWLALSLKKV